MPWTAICAAKADATPRTEIISNGSRISIGYPLKRQGDIVQRCELTRISIKDNGRGYVKVLSMTQYLGRLHASQAARCKSLKICLRSLPIAHTQRSPDI